MDEPFLNGVKKVFFKCYLYRFDVIKTRDWACWFFIYSENWGTDFQFIDLTLYLNSSKLGLLVSSNELFVRQAGTLHLIRMSAGLLIYSFFLINFSDVQKIKTYNTNKKERSTWILGSSYFYTFRIIFTDNLFLHRLLTIIFLYTRILTLFISIEFSSICITLTHTEYVIDYFS